MRGPRACPAFPETQAGKLVWRLLVDLPAKLLARVTPARATLGLILLIEIGGMIAYAKTEGLIVTGLGMPEALVWFATFDISTFFDVIAVAWLLAATVKFRAARNAVRSLFARARQWFFRRKPSRRGSLQLRERGPVRRRRKAPTRSKEDERASRIGRPRASPIGLSVRSSAGLVSKRRFREA